MHTHTWLPRRKSEQASHTTCAPVRPREGRHTHDGDPLRDELDALLERAAIVELHDSTEAQRLRADAQVLLAQLVTAGRLPAYLTIAPDDPLVVVIHMLAVVARKVNEAEATVDE